MKKYFIMISAILLAAGQSRRMNGENKLTKKINGIPLINHSVKNILSSPIDELIIVLGHQKENVEKLIDSNKKIKIVTNNNYKNGISSSIIKGLNNLSMKSDAFFICLADMPFVNNKVYNKLIESVNIKEILIPTYKNIRGNPILFSKNMKEKLLNIDGDIGGKKIINKNGDKVQEIIIEEDSITKDFNTKNNFNF